MSYRIKQVREDKRMSQEKLAELSGVSRTTISGLENGTIRATSTATLTKIARALGVTVNDIFFDRGV